MKPSHFAHYIALIACLTAGTYCSAADRFTKIVEEGGQPTVTSGGFVVNQKRVAVQKELSLRPPIAEELGVRLPPMSALMLEQTARQIAQYHPAWRVYEYKLHMPRSAFIKHFQDEGLSFDQSANQLKFSTPAGEFVDGLFGDPIKSFRIWRKP